jgi:hypothetical protein
MMDFRLFFLTSLRSVSLKTVEKPFRPERGVKKRGGGAPSLKLVPPQTVELLRPVQVTV